MQWLMGTTTFHYLFEDMLNYKQFLKYLKSMTEEKLPKILYEKKKN